MMKSSGRQAPATTFEVQAVWDKVRESGNLRVLVAVDSKRRGARRLTTEDFILAPDGSFVGE